MVICPIALAVHCTGCPFFEFCPAKTIIGDYGKENIGKSSAEKQKDKENKSEIDESSSK